MITHREEDKNEPSRIEAEKCEKDHTIETKDELETLIDKVVEGETVKVTENETPKEIKTETVTEKEAELVKEMLEGSPTEIPKDKPEQPEQPEPESEPEQPLPFPENIEEPPALVLTPEEQKEREEYVNKIKIEASNALKILVILHGDLWPTVMIEMYRQGMVNFFLSKPEEEIDTFLDVQQQAIKLSIRKCNADIDEVIAKDAGRKAGEPRPGSNICKM